MLLRHNHKLAELVYARGLLRLQPLSHVVRDERSAAQVEYSAEAGAAAHAIGRVTCSPDGTDAEGNPVSFTKGFFHVKVRFTGLARVARLGPTF